MIETAFCAVVSGIVLLALWRAPETESKTVQKTKNKKPIKCCICKREKTLDEVKKYTPDRCVVPAEDYHDYPYICTSCIDQKDYDLRQQNIRETEKKLEAIAREDEAIGRQLEIEENKRRHMPPHVS